MFAHDPRALKYSGTSAAIIIGTLSQIPAIQMTSNGYVLIRKFSSPDFTNYIDNSGLFGTREIEFRKIVSFQKYLLKRIMNE